MRLIEQEDLKEYSLANGVRARVVHTRNVSVVHVNLTAGAEIGEHMHDHEQVVNVVSGSIEHTADGKTTVLRAGSIVVLPPRIPHSRRALEDSYILDVLSPANKSFAKKHHPVVQEERRQLSAVGARV